VKLLEQSIRAHANLFCLKEDCTFLLNIFDGQRERIPHHSNLLPIQRDVFVESGVHAWRVELLAETGELPVFPFPVLAFCAHDNDTSVALVPDLYIPRDDGIVKLEARLDGKLRPFLQRTPSLIWRGGPHGDARRFMFGPGAKLWNHSDLLDIRSDDPMPMHEMANYQFQLDIDGEVSAWDALRWKLLSGSLVIKLKSHWKQWFYDSLIPGVHYVEITSLDQLDPTVRYYLNHIAEAQAIGERGRAFALATFNKAQCMKAIASTLAQSLTTVNHQPIVVTDMPADVGSQLYQYLLTQVLAQRMHTSVVFVQNWVGKQVFTAARNLPMPSSIDARALSTDAFSNRRVLEDTRNPSITYDTIFNTMFLEKYASADAVKLPLRGEIIHTSHFRPYRELIRSSLELCPAVLTDFERVLMAQAQSDDDCVALFVQTDDQIPVTWYSDWLLARVEARAPSTQRTVVFVDGDGNVQRLIARLMTLTNSSLFAFVDVSTTRSACSADLMRGPAAEIVSFRIMSRSNAVMTSSLSPLVVVASMINPLSEVNPTGPFVVADFTTLGMVEFDPWSTAWQ
jgi:hypothetical protein